MTNTDTAGIPDASEITPELMEQANAWDNAMQRAFKGIRTRKERRNGMIRATKRAAAEREDA